MNKEFIQIEKYLNNELHGEELEKFKARLIFEPEIEQEILLHSSVNNILEDKELIKFFTTLKQINNSIEETKIKQKSRKPVFLMVAGLLVVFSISIFTVLYLQNNNKISEKLLDTHYVLGISKGNNMSEVDIFKAYEFYNSKNYTQAIVEFETILKHGQNLNHIEFFLAVSYLNKNEFKKAINGFEKIINSENNYFTEAAKWYIAITLYKSGDLINAKIKFNEIANSKSSYKEKAVLLLKQL